MIRMIQSNSASHAKAYFSDALAKSDYYMDDQEMNGKFAGRLAERLGIKGDATKETFFALCENRNPQTGNALTPRTKQERTTGYDINFHCPKSVSILHALATDDHILKAFEESVADTMIDIEADSQTRVRKQGKYDDRQTGELVWAHFTHQTARPVEGHLPDPHLHSHCFVFNATWDDTEKQFKAGQFRDIKRDMPYYQARFHKRLSDKMMKMGYAVKRTEKSFEIEGVPQKVIDLFSKRTDEIGRVAKEKGISDAKKLSELGAKTRAKKQKGLSMKELKEGWKKQIREAVYSEEEGNKAVRHGEKGERQMLSPEQCLNHALQHSFERASVMAERRILETAYRYGLGNQSVSLDDISNKFKSDSRIIHVKEKNRTLCTTKDVLSEEKRMVQLARAGQGKMKPLYSKAPKLDLKDQQAEAVRHILTTPHRVSIIRGAAGSGKTTLMKEAVDHIEKADKKVFVLAPTSHASRGVLKEEGFEKADTVSRFLLDHKMQQETKHQVIWIDEAGLLGTKDMCELLDIATRNDARLILGGDTRQHASVVRGDALRILNTVGGIRTAEVSKIYRQKNVHYRSAVEELSKGNIRQGFDKLDAIGAIKPVDPLNPNDELVEDYVAAVKKGKKALVISPTHKQGDEVTGAIRKKLKQSGLIGKKELIVKRLANRNLTAAEKADWRNFKEGDLVQFNQNMPGVKRGSIWKIEKASEKNVRIKNESGQREHLPMHKSNIFDALEESEIALAKGDKIQITRNGFDVDEKRLNNGQTLDIIAVSKKGRIILRNAASRATYKLDKDYGHLAHAHCVTSHASQGKTVDEVFIAQPSATFSATDAKQFYVSVSRAREKVSIYTDDKTALLDYASELGERQSALELIGRKDNHIGHVFNMERNNHGKAMEPSDKQKERTDHSPVKDTGYEPRL